MRHDLVWDGVAFKNLREHRKVVMAMAELLVDPKVNCPLASVGFLMGAPCQPAESP